MAVLYLREYKQLGREAYGGPGSVIQAGLEPAVAQQTAAIGAGSVQTAEFNSETALVMVHVDAICHVNFGTNPTASTSQHRLPADATVYFGVTPGSHLKLAVITGT